MLLSSYVPLSFYSTTLSIAEFVVSVVGEYDTLGGGGGDNDRGKRNACGKRLYQ
jgi:hypothetical protein